MKLLKTLAADPGRSLAYRYQYMYMYMYTQYRYHTAPRIELSLTMGCCSVLA